MSDIVERLRAGEPCEEEGGCACQVEKRNAASGCLCAVAADTITTLRAENERLREMQRTVLVEQGEDVTRLRAENEKLRAALEQIAGYRMKGKSDADIARAALEE